MPTNPNPNRKQSTKSIFDDADEDAEIESIDRNTATAGAPTALKSATGSVFSSAESELSAGPIGAEIDGILKNVVGTGTGSRIQQQEHQQQLHQQSQYTQPQKPSHAPPSIAKLAKSGSNASLVNSSSNIQTPTSNHQNNNASLSSGNKSSLQSGPVSSWHQQQNQKERSASVTSSSSQRQQQQRQQQQQQQQAPPPSPLHQKKRTESDSPSTPKQAPHSKSNSTSQLLLASRANSKKNVQINGKVVKLEYDNHRDSDSESEIDDDNLPLVRDHEAEDRAASERGKKRQAEKERERRLREEQLHAQQQQLQLQKEREEKEQQELLKQQRTRKETEQREQREREEKERIQRLQEEELVAAMRRMEGKGKFSVVDIPADVDDEKESLEQLKQQPQSKKGGNNKPAMANASKSSRASTTSINAALPSSMKKSEKVDPPKASVTERYPKPNPLDKNAVAYDPAIAASESGGAVSAATTRASRKGSMASIKAVPVEEGRFVVEVPVARQVLEGMKYDPYNEKKESEKLEFPEEVTHLKYNEDDILFCKSLRAIMKNIAYLSSGKALWKEGEAWKETVVVIVSDGRAKINPNVLTVMGVMGLYMDGLTKAKVNDKDVEAHMFEYTLQASVDMNLERRGVHDSKEGINFVPVQTIFLLKEKNAKKINSHRWFFNAICQALDTEICILLDVGTKPTKESLFHLYNAFHYNENVGGACGEIAAELGKCFRNIVNPFVAVQNFEYKMSNILDKPLESVFGYISVLPGAFSAYRFEALKGKPLECYFHGEVPQGESVAEANMYLAEDRILCFELCMKKDKSWLLKYVKSAKAETDVPTELHDLISQRRRWLNGSFFAAVYAIYNWMRIAESTHSTFRKWALYFEFVYIIIGLFFQWFNIGNFYLSFYFLFGASNMGTSSSGVDPFYPNGAIIFNIINQVYIMTLISIFVLSLGNRPQGSKWLYLAVSVIFTILMILMLFMAIWTVCLSFQNLQNSGQTFAAYASSNASFRDIVISMITVYGVYFLSSLIHMDVLHCITCTTQYMLLLPTYVNVFMVYAFCNIHDVTWGTKGDNVPTPVGVVKTEKTADGKSVAMVEVPSEPEDIEETWKEDKAELDHRALLLSAKRYDDAPAKPSAQTAHDGILFFKLWKLHVNSINSSESDFFKQFRTHVVLGWILSNVLLVFIFTNSVVLSKLFPSTAVSSSVNPQHPEYRYLTFLFWSVAVLSIIRFIFSAVYMFGWWDDFLRDSGKRRPFDKFRKHLDKKCEMGPPIQTAQATLSPASPTGSGVRKGASGLKWFAVAALCLVAALAHALLAPMFVPFAFGAALSVPLHRKKAAVVAKAAKVGAPPSLQMLLVSILSFVFGSVYTLLEAYIKVYERNPVEHAHRPIVDFREEALPWPLFVLKWTIRATLLILSWSSASFRASLLLVAAGLVALRFASIHLNSAPTENPASPPLPPAKLKELWNEKITSLYIYSLVVLPLLATAFFANNLIAASPDLLYAGVSFIANPVPTHTPNPYSVIPDVGIRKLVLQYGVAEARAHAIKLLDAELSLSFPGRNVSCVDAAKIALGGFQVYKEKLYGVKATDSSVVSSSSSLASTSAASAEQFRARFPQVVEVIELAAYGRRIETLLKLGPAIAEVRWMGPDAFSFTLAVEDKTSSSYSSYHADGISEASLDPTGSVLGVVGPFFADLGFFSLVFFSTLGVLIYSDLGVHGYVARLVGKDLAAALIEPLDAAFLLNMDLLIFRVCLTHAVSIFVFPGNSVGLQVLLPFIAVAATLMPMFPIFLPLGIIPAVILFVVFNSPWAALLVVYVQMFWSPEQTIVDQHMGLDGIAIVDGFATWMGWMAFDMPAGLVIGPWCFVALRRVYSVIVDK
ncbi:UNVERIFIED_CONTAM: Chitin synthase, class 2 [Siphonaria sp. JEL0065]|nr:Chitin synthase, class 2 [Siphonaria sp. JEL0065]